MQDRERFVRAFSALGACFSREQSAEMCELYWLGCGDLTDDEFSAAASRAISECEFFPLPAVLRQLAGRQLAGKDDRKAFAMREWDAVQKAVSSVGAYGSVLFKDPATAKAVESLGGWQGLCRPEEPDHWLRKRFIDTWMSYDSVRDTLPEPQLTRGLIEAENGGKWSSYTPKPVLVGSENGRRKLAAGPPGLLSH